MCLVRPALLYLSVQVLKVFYEQINYYYYKYYYYLTPFPRYGELLCPIFGVDREGASLL